MNIVLIGMPGSGKSTLGRLLAERTGRDFFDTDALVEEVEGQPIPAIFAKSGEDYFRGIEALVITDVAQVKNAVIATGGGVILRPENMAHLAATGHIVFIDRAPEDILGEDHAGRPLLAGDRARIFALHTQRLALYQRYAHHTIQSGPAVADTLGRLLDTLEREALL